MEIPTRPYSAKKGTSSGDILNEPGSVMRKYKANNMNAKNARNVTTVMGSSPWSNRNCPKTPIVDQNIAAVKAAI